MALIDRIMRINQPSRIVLHIYAVIDKMRWMIVFRNRFRRIIPMPESSGCQTMFLRNLYELFGEPETIEVLNGS